MPRTSLCTEHIFVTAKYVTECLMSHTNIQPTQPLTRDFHQKVKDDLQTHASKER